MCHDSTGRKRPPGPAGRGTHSLCVAVAQRRGAHNITVTTFDAEPEAPRLSVTVTVIVWVPSGRTYVCPVLWAPCVAVLPLVDDQSPQLIVYDHGPSLSGSLKDQFRV